MASPAELERLAGMVNKLRPDWPARSVRTYLAAKHGDRAFADLAVALAVIATDPTADTPARLEQHGAWWAATRVLAGGVPEVGPGGRERCRRPGHEHEAAGSCRLCRAEQLTGTEPSQPAPAITPPASWRPTRKAS